MFLSKFYEITHIVLLKVAMDKREKIETTIKLLDTIELFAQESKVMLCGVLGEMDAARDYDLLNRAKFGVIEGARENSKEEYTAEKLKIRE